MRVIKVECINPDCANNEQVEYRPIGDRYYSDSFTCFDCGWKVQVERVPQEADKTA